MIIVAVLFSIITAIAAMMAFIDKKNEFRNTLILSVLCAITTLCCIVADFSLGSTLMGIVTVLVSIAIYVKRPRG